MRPHRMLVAVIVSLFSLARADEGSDLLVKLTALDAAYATNLSATGTDYARPALSQDVPVAKRTWEVSGTATSFAAEFTTIELFPLEVPDAAPAQFGGTPTITTRTAFLIGEPTTGMASWYVGDWKSGPMDGAHLVPAGASVHRRAAGSQEYSLFRSRLLFYLGRGFSAYLGRIEKVEHQGDELRVTAAGRGNGGVGTWTLVLLPQADFMAREAIFHGPHVFESREDIGPRGSSIRVLTEGLQRSGDRFAPTQGEYFEDLFRKKYSYTVTSFGPSAGNAMAERLAKEFCPPFAVRTMLTDASRSPETSTSYEPGKADGKEIRREE